MVVIVTILCVTLSLLTVNAASLHIHQLQPSHESVASGYLQLDHPALKTRKLMFNNEIEVKDLESSNGKNKDFKGESYMKEEEVKVMMHAAKGTRQEWIEGSDPTHEFFTMDYSHVRRRRPIHNKSYRKNAISSP